MSQEPWIEHDWRNCKNKKKKQENKHYECPGNCGGSFVNRWRTKDGTKIDGHRWFTSKEAEQRKKVIVDLDRNNALGFGKEITLSEALLTFGRIIGPGLQNENARANYCGIIERIATTKEISKKLFHLVSYMDIASYWSDMVTQGYKKSTIKKELMAIHACYERFQRWNAMVPEIIPHRIALPEFNPVKVAKSPECLGRKWKDPEGSRKRYLTKEELRQAYGWCSQHDPELFEVMMGAIVTALRKGDLMSLTPGQAAEGVQGKTRRIFDLPYVVDPLNFMRLRYRWDHLRGAMGWLPAQKGMPENPLRVTWHDLRHCGPTILAGLGFSSKIIQQLLGQASEKMAQRYTHTQREALRPAIEALRKEFKQIALPAPCNNNETSLEINH